MSSVLTTRFMFLPNAGYGNPDQYRIISPTVVNYKIPRANYDLTAINSRNEDENFVVFARPNKRFKDEIPGINNGDIINLFDFIFDVIAKRLANSCSKDERKLVIELDLSRCPGAIELIQDLSCYGEKILTNFSKYSPMALALMNILRARIQDDDVEILVVNPLYSSLQCKAYFFPNCHGRCHCGRD